MRTADKNYIEHVAFMFSVATEEEKRSVIWWWIEGVRDYASDTEHVIELVEELRSAASSLC